MEVLKDLGHEVSALDSFMRWDGINPVSRRIQQSLCAGPVVSALNSEVLREASRFRPELVWAEKQEFLTPETWQSLRSGGARLLHYTPDPYFTLGWKRTRLMDESLPLFEYLVTSKQYELDAYSKFPGKVIYVPLGFGDLAHRPALPVNAADYGRYQSDVSFIGGWEPRRESLLDLVSSIAEMRLKIWGYGWDHLGDGRTTARRLFAMRRNAGGQGFTIRHNPRLAACVQGSEIYDEEYAWAISSARIGLGFLRKICPDQHTTRTFEIPACGSMLLADRTDEHQDFFEEGTEAEFFSSDDEMIDKLRFYSLNEKARGQIASRGFVRCHSSGYSYRARVSQVMAQI